MKRHSIVIELAGSKDHHVSAPCKGDGCPLCASTAENRARISFVKAR